MVSYSRPMKKPKVESTILEPNWLELPRDVTENIFQKVGVIEIVRSVSQVCSLWWNLCKDPLMWRTIDMTNNPPYYGHSTLIKICRFAVKRSCGRLEDINIESFADEKLLKYIVDSTSNLRRMRLAKCPEISDWGFHEVVKKLSLLEELDISHINLFEVKSPIELIGRSCPRLKTLKLNNIDTCIFLINKGNDNEALAIAKTMPNLHHLELSENSLTNDGLIAILDGCPHLESLHLRDCYYVDLSGSLRERCHEQIKDLKVLCGYHYTYGEYNFWFGNEDDVEDEVLQWEHHDGFGLGFDEPQLHDFLIGNFDQFE